MRLVRFGKILWDECMDIDFPTREVLVEYISGLPFENQDGSSFLYILDTREFYPSEPVRDGPGCKDIGYLCTTTSLDLHGNKALGNSLIPRNTLHLVRSVDTHSPAHIT